jgi:lysophospholipase L1-like esterase
VIELCLEWFHPVPFRRPIDQVPDTAWTRLVHRRSAEVGLAYELSPGATLERRGASISVNSLGFRGPEVSVEKPEGTIRIALLGDSVAFGWTVSDEGTHSARIERMLNERVGPGDARYEVLNFGVGGYSTRDEVAMLAAKALPLDPDLVVIDYVPNDPESEPVQPLHQVFHETLWWERWNLLRLLSFGRRQLGVTLLGDGNEYRYLASPRARHWPTVLAAFDQARDLCAPRGIEVVVVLFPTYTLRVDWSDYADKDLQEQVIEAAHARGFRALDLVPVYAQSGYSMDEIAADDIHPGDLGLEIAARAVADLILEHHQELLGRPPP